MEETKGCMPRREREGKEEGRKVEYMYGRRKGEEERRREVRYA